MHSKGSKKMDVKVFHLISWVNKTIFLVQQKLCCKLCCNFELQSSCRKVYMWIPSTRDRECDKTCVESTNIKNYTCKERIFDKLVLR